MQKFTINISINQNKDIHMQMEPCSEVMSVAKILSAAYQGSIVSVSMFARNRRVYKDGRMESSFPDLERFYSNTTEEDRWSWSCFGQVED